MLRAVLVAVLSTGALGGCKAATDQSAAPVPGVAAGKVLEVTGTVTVKHGDASRPLAVGETVEGADTIITGDDGNVVIELAHNSARWELGPNKQQKVNESIAWKAAKTSGPAKDVEQDTAAAGRPAERNAAGTVAMADVEGTAREEAAVERDVPKQKVRREERAKAVAPRAPARASASAGVKGDIAEVASEEQPARTTRGAVMKKESALAPPPPSAPAAAAPSPPGSGMGASVGAAAPVTVSTQLTAKQAELRACLVQASHGGDVSVAVKVAGGKPVVSISSLDQSVVIGGSVQTCIDRVVAGIAFSVDGSHTLTIKRP